MLNICDEFHENQIATSLEITTNNRTNEPTNTPDHSGGGAEGERERREMGRAWGREQWRRKRFYEWAGRPSGP